MDIKFIKAATMNADEGYQKTVATLPLCGQGRPEGQATGMVPIKLASGVVVTPKVTVYSSTSTNRKGAVSAVVKVSIPYTALSKDLAAANAIITDPSRSGGDLSVHFVVGLPKAAVSDLKSNDVDILRAAQGQLAVIVRMLCALLGPRFIDEGYADISYEGESTIAVASPARYILGDTQSEPANVQSVVPVDNIVGYQGDTGFDVSAYAPTRTISEPLTRIVNGSAPLACGDITANSVTTTLAEIP